MFATHFEQKVGTCNRPLGESVPRETQWVCNQLVEYEKGGMISE